MHAQSCKVDRGFFSFLLWSWHSSGTQWFTSRTGGYSGCTRENCCHQSAILSIFSYLFQLWYLLNGNLFFRCQCRQCSDENLAGALEFRCCKEVANASAKMTFDGSVERITCITQHEDYVALTNRTVLMQVAPLLRDTSGRTYRRRTGVPEEE